MYVLGRDVSTLDAEEEEEEEEEEDPEYDDYDESASPAGRPKRQHKTIRKSQNTSRTNNKKRHRSSA